jgi:hypothetical protein
MKRMTIVSMAVLCILFICSAAGLAMALDIKDIEIGIGIGAPPPLEFAQPPELVPIPGRYAYFVPDVNFDLYFYQGRWFRPYKKAWFRSDHYAGPWERVHEVPSSLTDLPHDYRTMPPSYYRVPFGELKNNWERWEREKYWDRRAEDRGFRDREREGMFRPSAEFDQPPELVPIPGRYVYFVPDIDFDLFFYQGRWFRPLHRGWFISQSYAGPWEYVHEVPSQLMDLPRDYRTIPPRYYRVPFRELLNNWERWEREKYWDRRAEDRDIRERDREDRDSHHERERGRY